MLAGVMTWGASVSGGSAFVGFSGARSLGGPDRVGGFEMRFLDGVVVRSRTHLYALAQMAGSVGAGPAAGLVDPVILTMTTDVDLSGGFTVEVDGCVLGSVDAVNPSGDAGRYRYWMWDAPCETWLTGEQAEFRITTDDASVDGSEQAVAPLGLRATVADGAVNLGWDASPVVAPLRAAVVYAVWRERVDEADSGGVGDEPVHNSIAGTGLADSDVVAGGTYRYAVSVANEGYDNSSPPGESVTVEVPELLGDSDPGVTRFTVGDADPVDLEPDTRRRDVAVDSGGGHTTVTVEANAFDARLSARTIRADLFTVGDQDLGAPVYLSERGDTLVIVYARSGDGTQEQAYTLRLRPPDTTANVPNVPKGGLGSVPPVGVGSVSEWLRGPRSGLGVRAVSDPSLSALTLNSGTLAPAFAAGTPEYGAAVAHDVDEVTVTPTAAAGTTAMVVAPDADPDATGHQVALNASTQQKPAQTVIVIAVSNSDGRLDSYTVTVTRAVIPASDNEELRSDPLSDDVSLAALSLSNGDLSPAFDTTTDAYSTTVAASTGWVTVTAAATFDGAQVDISPADANPLLAGHQVDLAASPDGAADGSTDIDVTVTAEDQTTGTYSVTVTRPPATSFRGTGVDVINSGRCGVRMIKGIWSDAQTLWVTNSNLQARPKDVFMIDIATGSCLNRLGMPNLHVTFYDDLYSWRTKVVPSDVWSDGESMWVLDRWGSLSKHEILNHEPGAFAIGPGEQVIDSVGHHAAAGRHSYSLGMWSDGEIIWIVNSGLETTKVRAFELDTGTRRRDLDLPIRAPGGYNNSWGISDKRDMWSDGSTAWVVHAGEGTGRAFDLDTGDRREHLDIKFSRWDHRLSRPSGLWSDGGTMWVGNSAVHPSPDLILGFYLPTEAALDSLSVSDADIGTFSPWSTAYSATVTSTTEMVTIEAAAQHDDASVVILSADADPGTDGHQVSLVAGDNTITVTAGTYNHTMTYTLTITR